MAIKPKAMAATTEPGTVNIGFLKTWRPNTAHFISPFTTVATGPPRNVRPSNGEFRLFENDWFTS